MPIEKGVEVGDNYTQIRDQILHTIYLFFSTEASHQILYSNPSTRNPFKFTCNIFHDLWENKESMNL